MMDTYFRNLEIIRLSQEGHSLRELSKRFGISSQRVHQILNPEKFYRRKNKWRRAKRLADQSSV